VPTDLTALFDQNLGFYHKDSKNLLVQNVLRYLIITELEHKNKASSNINRRHRLEDLGRERYKDEVERTASTDKKSLLETQPRRAAGGFFDWTSDRPYERSNYPTSSSFLPGFGGFRPKPHYLL
jgi:hypothetical protein